MITSCHNRAGFLGKMLTEKVKKAKGHTMKEILEVQEGNDG